MKNLLFIAAGVLVMGLAMPAGAQLPVSALRETFEDDALRALPSAYGPAYWGNDSIVVKSGNGGIASPDGSKKYAKFVGPRRGASYWFNDASVYPCVLSLDNSLSADFYIKPKERINQDVYLASTFWVNGKYNGEVGVGYTLLNDGSGNVVFHVTRYGLGHKGSQKMHVSPGWYHLEMLFADSDADGKVDVTGVITDADGDTVFSWLEPTDFAADATYTTAGFQIQAGETAFVPLRVDNLLATAGMTVELTTEKGYIDLSDKKVDVLIHVAHPANVVEADIGGVDAKKLKADKGGTMATFKTAGMLDGIFVGELSNGTLIRGEIEVR